MEHDDRSFVPWFIKSAPFLGQPPALPRRQWHVLGLISLVTLFDQYDLALFSLALKQIQAELAVPEATVGQLGALVRLGALPAFFLMVLADRIGRRQVLLVTILLYTLFTGLTAFAPSARWFVGFQFLARTFTTTEVLLANVVLSEELDADHRGWGIGALGALGAFGHGLAMLAFSLVDVLPLGWRCLYLIGLVPLILLSWMRRALPETHRFDAQAVATRSVRDALAPVLHLLRMYPGRLAPLALVVFLLHFAENAAHFFAPKYFQDRHGWSPAQFAAMGVLGGFLGIFGSAFAGRLSDQHGRKLVASALLLLHPLCVIGYYNASGWWLPALWVGAVFTGIGGGIVLATLGNELFPTSHRSTASGTRMVVGTLGGVSGLYAESVLYTATGSHWTAISALCSLALVAPLVVNVFPETQGRSLEDISPERH